MLYIILSLLNLNSRLCFVRKVLYWSFRLPFVIAYERPAFSVHPFHCRVNGPLAHWFYHREPLSQHSLWLSSTARPTVPADGSHSSQPVLFDYSVIKIGCKQSCLHLPHKTQKYEYALKVKQFEILKLVLWGRGYTRSHSEHGSKVLYHRWYSERGRVGRRQL